jgi:hypothetical protein
MFAMAAFPDEGPPQPPTWVPGSIRIRILYLRAGKLPATKVAMYAYVNPVIAVVLGWLILDERLTGACFEPRSFSEVVLMKSSRS